ncbi:zinc finger, CCHC-type containing protein [Tanacetum coccineum]
MAEDASSKKFLVRNFNNYKIVDSRPVMEQFNKLLRILGQYTQHGLKMDESIFVSSVIDKLPPFWNDFKHSLKHGKDDLSLVQLGSHLRIEESLKAQESDKAKEKKLLDPRNINWNVGSVAKLITLKGIAVVETRRITQVLVVRERGLRTNPKTKIDSGATTHVYKDRCWFKTYESVEDGFVLYMGDDHFAFGRVRLPDPKRKTLGEKGIDCIFVGYAEHSKTYRFYVIEPNDSISINSIIELRDVIFDENRFSSIPRPKDIIPNSDESRKDDHSNDVPIEGSRDQIGSPYSYCYSIEEDPRTYNEAMQSRDVASWKEAIGDEIGSIMENNTWVLSDLPLGCKPLGCKWIFKRKLKVDGTIDKFKSRLVIQGFRQKEGIDYFDTYVPVARITTISFVDKI